VLTNPTNLYSQADLKSRDVALTFHIGLALRLAYRDELRVPVAPSSAALLPGSWRRWQPALETYKGGDEAEDFQAVGVRLREWLISFVDEAASDEIVPDGATPPKAADFKVWTELLANYLAPGDRSAPLRSYLKKHAVETWDLVAALVHAKNAVRLDAEVAIEAVEHLLGVFTAAAGGSIERSGGATSAAPTTCAAAGASTAAGSTSRMCRRSRRGSARRSWPPVSRSRARRARTSRPSCDPTTCAERLCLRPPRWTRRGSFRRDANGPYQSPPAPASCSNAPA
jgi:hypothetical protein